MSASESNLERFKSLEKSSHENSRLSGKMSISKNNSMSRKSKLSKNIVEDRYKPEDDLLNDFDGNNSSLKKEVSGLNISEKGQSRVESSSKSMEDNNNQSKNERFVVTKDEQKYEEELE